MTQPQPLQPLQPLQPRQPEGIEIHLSNGEDIPCEARYVGTEVIDDQLTFVWVAVPARHPHGHASLRNVTIRLLPAHTAIRWVAFRPSDGPNAQ